VDKEQLKKRIVGAIVLVALGVIFIPMILSGDNEASGIWGNNIPEKPKALQALAEKPMPAMPPLPPEVAGSSTIVDAASKPPVDAQPTPVTTTLAPNATLPSATATDPAQTMAVPAKTETVDAGKPAVERAWVVQIGSFNQQANAMALRDKLLKKKYAAFVDTLQTGQSTTYRVRVGPHVRRADADTQATRLAKEFKIKGVVLPHP
jgi:DedD protein